jgi:hypothetical protein
MAFELFRLLQESMLDDTKGSIHKALANVLGIDDEAAVKLVSNVSIGDELNLIELLDKDVSSKKEIMNFLSLKQVEIPADILAKIEGKAPPEPKEKPVEPEAPEEPEEEPEEETESKEEDEEDNLDAEDEDEDTSEDIDNEEKTKDINDQIDGLFNESSKKDVRTKEEKLASRANMARSNPLMKKGGPQIDKKKEFKKKGENKRTPIEEDLINNFDINETVVLNDGRCATIIQEGPNRTYRVSINGEITMVKRNEISESVMGITGIPSIERMRQLAGMRTPVREEEEYDNVVGSSPALSAGPVDVSGTMDAAGASDLADNFPGGETGMVSMGDDATDYSSDYDEDLDDDADFEVGNDVDAELDTPVMPSAPPSVPSIEPVAMPAVSADAYGEIQDLLNGVQGKILDIKLSEFKPLLSRLESLVSEIRGRGIDALREHRNLTMKNSKIVETSKKKVRR